MSNDKEIFFSNIAILILLLFAIVGAAVLSIKLWPVVPGLCSILLVVDFITLITAVWISIQTYKSYRHGKT